MIKQLVATICILFSTAAASAKDQMLVIHQIRGGLDYKSEVEVKGPQQKTTEFELKGYYDSWKCEAWSWDQKDEVLLTCYSPHERSPWKLQASIYCDSEDSFFIDAVTVKCKGNKPVQFWGK